MPAVSLVNIIKENENKEKKELFLIFTYVL